MVPRKEVKSNLKKLTCTPIRKPANNKLRDLQSQLNKKRGIKDTEDDGESDSSTLPSSQQSTTSTTSSASLMSTDTQLGQKQVIDVTTKPTQVHVPPSEKVTPKKASAATGKPLNIVYVDIHTQNDENFEGTLSKVEAKGIWEALGQKASNIKRITIKKGRYAKVGFDLHNPIKITELSCKPSFNIEFTRGHVTDVYKIKLPDFDDLAYQVGDIATVSIINTGLETSAGVIRDWISKFGKISGEIRYTNSVYCCDPVGFYIDQRILLLAPSSLRFNTSLNLIHFPYRSPVDSDNIGTDEWIVDVELSQHIPEQLPIKGNRALVYYPGIPRQCKTCFETGHIAPKCPNGKEDYLNYVVRFLKSGHFDERMIGGWLDALKKYHADYNS